MSDFSSIASFYREKSLVQASAGSKLTEMLAIPPDADILDAGCGAGNLTADLRDLTSGSVVGIDPSAGMIRQSREAYPGSEIEFRVMGAEELDYDNNFDILFCSSAFQWFRQPEAVLTRFHRALRPGGRVGMQAPATSNYCPNFIRAIDHCRHLQQLDTVFAGFRSPWFFLETADAYGELFSQAGFRVLHCRIEAEHGEYTVDQAVGIFRSGAAAGFLNQAYYAAPLPDDFAEQVLHGIMASFEEQAAPQGVVHLLFHRVFVVAEKPAVPGETPHGLA